MSKIFKPLEEARREYTKNMDYLYLMIIGVQAEHQGKGHGKRLLLALLEKADSMKLPIYLETATDSNIKMYEKLGFQVLGKVDHPVINLPQWCMLRPDK